MKIDNLGRCILDTESALEYLYKGGDLFDANLSDEAVKEFNDPIQKLKDGFTVYYKYEKFSFLKSIFQLLKLSINSLKRKLQMIDFRE